MIAGVHGALVFGLIWTAACFGTSEDRDPQAAATDGGGPAVDGPVPDGGAKKPDQKRHSLAVSGRGHHSLHNFTMNDKQGREVVRLKMRGALGRLGINIAAHVKKDKMSYEHKAVHINGGPGCE